MNSDNNNREETTEGVGWRYCYECEAPESGSRLRVPGEAEAYFWYLLGYRIHRMVERAP